MQRRRHCLVTGAITAYERRNSQTVNVSLRREPRPTDSIPRLDHSAYTYGDSDVISMPTGFRRHLVGKTLRNICYCNIAEIRSVAKLVIIDIFINQWINFF